MGARGVLRTARRAAAVPLSRLWRGASGAGRRRPRSSLGFNGDYDKPTFTPSVRVGGHKVIRDVDGKWTGEWERDAAGNPVSSVCHSFVRDGSIQFLTDCTHAMAGQTVPLEPF